MTKKDIEPKTPPQKQPEQVKKDEPPFVPGQGCFINPDWDYSSTRRVTPEQRKAEEEWDGSSA